MNSLKFKKFFILLSLFIFANAQAYNFLMPFSLDNEEVNHYLMKKVQVEKNYGFPGIFTVAYKINDLTAEIGKTPNKIEMQANVIIKAMIANEKFDTQLQVTFDTTPYYDAKKGAIFLKDFRIIKWDGLPTQNIQIVQQILPTLNNGIATIFENIPLYTLNEDSLRDRLIKKFAKGIVVEKGKLGIDVEI